MVEGKLSYDSARKTWKIVFYNEKKKSDSTLFCHEKSQFSTDLNLSDESIEIEIEFERLPNGDPIKIRQKGQEWQGQERVQTVNYNRQSQGQDDRSERNFQTPPRNNPISQLKGEFHNPYNFVPAVPRANVGNGLGDDKPIGHDKFYPNHYTGKLTVKMTVETPLLVIDTAQAIVDENDHKHFPVRVENGKPCINPTAVKGMLRSAYEVVTNSRMSVFNKHDDRLAFRSEAKLGAVPARVVKKEDSNLYFRVMKSQLLRLGFAAKLKRYKIGDNLGKDKGERFVAKTYNDKAYTDENLPKNEDAVWVQLNSKGAVEYIVRRKIGETKTGWQSGWVCVTGANISGKRNERVFLENPADRLIKIEKRHLELWNELISNYQEIHQKDLAERARKDQKPSDYLDSDPGKTAWSHHIYEKTGKDLREGTLCYLNFNRNSESEIDAVIPVTISRRLFEVSPSQLLSKDLQPAKLITQLSPADRVFGWVRQGKIKETELPKEENKLQEIGAYRGQIRVGTLICKTDKESAIQDFNDLPLNILGQPKPQQGRFYVAETPKTGEAQIEKRNNEEAGYKAGRSLRGRKVYPHHNNLPPDFWLAQKDGDFSDKNNLKSGNQYREYFRPPGEKQKNDQNRSIQGWVKPNTEFEFDIQFTNLSEVELGALVWLLQLPDNHFHRFGGGKPYGFGSVKLAVEKSEITSGKALEEFYLSLDSEQSQSKTPEECKASFESAVKSAYPNSNFLNSFLRACEGFSDNLPIHYPRKKKEPNMDGKSFEWFVENSKIERGTVKNGYVLKDLISDDGLPYLS